MQTNKSSYLTGLANMASSLSKEIGPSYIEVDCFDKKNYQKEFQEYYEIKENIELIETNLKLENILSFWLGKDRNIIESLIHWTSCAIGNPIKVYKLENENKILNKLSRSEGGLGPFYTTEEIYFIEFKNDMTCFMIGNDE